MTKDTPNNVYNYKINSKYNTEIRHVLHQIIYYGVMSDLVCGNGVTGMSSDMVGLEREKPYTHTIIMLHPLDVSKSTLHNFA